ncbi:MAG: ABC-type transport auxiliary lipoprotein family protein [Candidatus Hatepunaea meridiana]|nr:ABC-type transport auxiliary lipoprotein family protein [Candidatus Hatepunaea meridiana]
MKTKQIIIFIIAALLIAGCTRQTLVTSYYLLEYQPSPNNNQLILDKPIPFRVQVRNFKIPRSYDSIRIIARFSSHQINYYRYSLWAVRPQIAVADLLVQHINSYHLFKDCQREYLEERPEYEITGEILQIEKFDNEQYSAAHLRMSFDLYDYDSKDRLVNHTFDREIPTPTESMTIFAKVISDIVEEETEIFLSKVVEYFYPPESDSTQVSE